MRFFRQEYCNALHTFSSSRGSFLHRIEPMSPVSPEFQVDSLLAEPSVQFSSVQFSHSVVSLYDPMDCTAPGLPVHHQLLELSQTHVLRVSDAIQPSPPLSPLFLQPSIFPSFRVFSNKSVLHIRWPTYCLREALEFFSSPQLCVRGFTYYLHFLLSGASLLAQKVKNLPEILETLLRSLGQEDPLEKGMATPLVFLPGEFHGWRSLAIHSRLRDLLDKQGFQKRDTAGD